VRVDISSFCIDRDEASSTSVRGCVREGACPQNGYLTDAAVDADMPGVLPTAVDAEAYCAWRGGRLPTDAEWDAAARGPDGESVAWAHWDGTAGNYCGTECEVPLPSSPDDGHAEAAPRGSYGHESPYGLLDTAGNLWEWVGDCFDATIRARADGMSDPVAASDPLCHRFLRGGSFRSYPGLLERRVGHGSVDIDVPTRGARCAYDFGTVHQVVSRASEGWLAALEDFERWPESSSH